MKGYTRLIPVCISLIIISLMFVGQSYGIDPETCVGMWLLNEGEGDVAHDSSGNGNDGTLTDGPQWGQGKFDKAVEFDGSDDWVDFGDASDVLDVETGEITVVYWLYLNAKTDNYIGLVRMTAADTHSRFEPAFQNNNLQIYTNDGSWHDTGNTLDLNTWSHVAWAKAGNTLKLYINGQDTGWSMGHTSSLGPFTSLMFGKHVGYLNGILDEVAIFNVGLTEDDIQTIMNEGLQNVVSAVDLSGKLATTWSTIKTQ